MMIVTGLQWAAMPPSRVETIDVKTVHLRGEFVEGNLGTTLGPDGKVTVRLVAQQYSFEPQCIVVPAEMPVTFRATSTDAIHGFVVGHDQRQHDADPRLRRDVHDDVPQDRGATDAVSRVLRHRVTRRCGVASRLLPPAEFLAKARGGERLPLCSSLKRLVLAHFWVAFVAFLGAIVLGEWQMYVRSPLAAWVNNPGALLPVGHGARHGDGLRAADAGRHGVRLRPSSSCR